jgi:hypothetical protein
MSLVLLAGVVPAGEGGVLGSFGSRLTEFLEVEGELDAL